MAPDPTAGPGPDRSRAAAARLDGPLPQAGRGLTRDRTTPPRRARPGRAREPGPRSPAGGAPRSQASRQGDDPPGRRGLAPPPGPAPPRAPEEAGRRIACWLGPAGASPGKLLATAPIGPAPAGTSPSPPAASRARPATARGPQEVPDQTPVSGPAWDEPHPWPGTNPDGRGFLCACACARRKYRAKRKPFPIGPNTLTHDEKSTGLCSGFSSGS